MYEIRASKYRLRVQHTVYTVPIRYKMVRTLHGHCQPPPGPAALTALSARSRGAMQLWAAHRDIISFNSRAIRFRLSCCSP